MKRVAKRILPARIVNAWIRFKLNFLDGYAAPSYAQEGEDMILKRIFEGQPSGFYVDVGAHHPKRFSNTFHFYQKGWSGINIDATPGSMRLFSKTRPRDINVEAAIARSKREMSFFIFNEAALNSFDEHLSRTRAKEPYHIVEERKITTKTLAQVLGEHLPSRQGIDFLSVDVEGFDLEVLESNDWQLFRPKYILVECLGQNLQELRQGPIYKFLEEKGYSFFAKTVNTVIFREQSL